MKKYVIGNLKMNLMSVPEREAYLKGIDRAFAGKKLENTEIILCPPSIHLEAFKKWKNKRIKRGAQNIFFEDKGSYTGETSPLQVKNFGCEYAIVGHSERRRYFGESGECVNFKIISAMKHELRPVLCIGETKEEKDAERTQEVVTAQLKEALVDVSRVRAKQIIIAYEPVWSVEQMMCQALMR